MESKRPNILLILADQLVPMLTGAYGHPVVKTPSLDRLVAGGTRFDAAYSPHPVCVPARACLFTGLYSSRNGVLDNGAEFCAELPTFFHHLRDTGYHCCASGKMHWIGPDQLHGLNERISLDVCKPGFGLTPNWRAPQKKHHAQSYVTARPERWNQHRYFDEQAHFTSVNWLREWASRDRDQPFFHVVSYHHPHEPFRPPHDLWDLYRDEQIEIPEVPDDLEDHLHAMDRWNNDYHGVAEVDMRDPDALRDLRRAYYACVSYVDIKVGELMEVLQDSELAENTVVVFASDHGDMLGERCMVQKRSFYEYSSRIALIASAPGRWTGGQRIAAPVSLLDLFSTFIELSGKQSPPGVDSQSLLPLLEGAQSDSDRIVFSESLGQGVEHPCFMARKENLKYIHVHTETPQLYDLSMDPGEWNNLAGSNDYRSREQDMREAILSRFDPEEIERRALASQERRLFLLRVSGTELDREWGYHPTAGGAGSTDSLY